MQVLWNEVPERSYYVCREREPDPFSATIEAVCEIKRYDYYVVPQHMQGNLQAIARKLYQNPHMYWVLQFYKACAFRTKLPQGLS